MRRLLPTILLAAAFFGCASRPQICPFTDLPKEIIDIADHNPPAYGVVGGKVISNHPELYPAVGVRLIFVSPKQGMSPTTTTREGEFAFYQVPTGIRLRIEVQSYGFRPQESETFILSPGEKIAFCFHLRSEPPAVITMLRSPEERAASKHAAVQLRLAADAVPLAGFGASAPR